MIKQAMSQGMSFSEAWKFTSFMLRHYLANTEKSKLIAEYWWKGFADSWIEIGKAHWQQIGKQIEEYEKQL